MEHSVMRQVFKPISAGALLHQLFSSWEVLASGKESALMISITTDAFPLVNTFSH